MPEKRHVKVLKLHILKPAGDMTWNELSSLLSEARYRVFRLANMAISETYLNYHEKRVGKTDEYKTISISKLNKQLRGFLEDENKEKDLLELSKEGALPSTVTSPLSRYKLNAVLKKSKWTDITRGRSTLPTFRLNTSIPVRCDQPYNKRLERNGDSEIEVDLMVKLRPYPRVVIATARNSLGDSQRAILDRLLDNTDNSIKGYRQRCFEVKHDKRAKKWNLFVTYDFPAAELELSKERIIGVDLGFSCPLYAAINNGHARLGWQAFKALTNRIRSLQKQTIKRRREILRGGSQVVSHKTGRTGHGRARKLKASEMLEGKIKRAYNTLNHQLSSAVIKFAQNHGAGIIQIENLKGLNYEITGSFLGERWQYEPLQRFIKYKAAEASIEVREVDARYTSRRCSKCGHINMEFDRAFRDSNKITGKPTNFTCPECEYEANPDYNAARNLSIEGIDKIINDQLIKQGLDKKAL